MKSDISIIKVLLENRDKELNILTISKLAKKDYKNTYDVIKRLEKKEILKIGQFGKSNKIQLINQVHPLLFETEYERRNELLKNKDFRVMLNYFRNMHSKLYILLLFGSYAKKTNIKHSDIDLLFIVPDLSEEQMKKEIHSIANTIPLKLHINVFKEADFKAMKNSREITAGSEAMKHNIILHGIEAYYELIK